MVSLLASLVFAATMRPALAIDAEVTYENAGDYLAKELADISSLAEVELLAGSEMAGEVLVLRFDGQPLSGVMKQIAWAVDAEWVPKNGGYVLKRPAGRQKAEEDRETSKDADTMRRAFRAWAEESAKDRPFDAKLSRKVAEQLTRPAGDDDFAYPHGTWQDRASMNEDAPARRVIRRIGGLLEPEPILRLGDEDRLVYSNHPNRHQRQMSVAMEAAIQSYVREQALLTGQMNRSGHDNPPDNANGHGWALRPADVGTMLVVVTPFFPGSLEPLFYVSAFDKQGRLMGEEGRYRRLQWHGDEAVNSSRTETSLRSLKIPASAIQARISNPAKPITKALPQISNDLLNPGDTHPLSPVRGATLLAISQAEGLPLVASVPDEYGMPDPNETTDARDYVQALVMDDCDQGADSGWLSLRPKRLAMARASHVDRNALRAYLQLYRRPSAPALDELADLSDRITLGPFMYSEGSPSSSKVAFRLRAEVSPTRYDEIPNDRFLRFYKTLSQQERGEANSGGLRMGALGRVEAGRLMELLLSQTFELSFLGNDGTGRIRDLGPSAPGAGIRGEPTELFANGPPGNGTIRVTATNADYVLGPSSLAGMRTNRKYSWSTIAQCVFEQIPPLLTETERKGIFPPLNAGVLNSSYKEWRFVPAMRYQVRMQFAPNISWSDEFVCEGMNDGSGVPFDKLPAGFRQRVVDEVRRLKKEDPNNAHGKLSTLPGER